MADHVIDTRTHSDGTRTHLPPRTYTHTGAVRTIRGRGGVHYKPAHEEAGAVAIGEEPVDSRD
jgi:hypothetical protein